MKLIEAYVRSVMFDHVVQALMHIHIQGFSFVEMRGIGHTATDPEAHWGGEFEHVHKIEIICHDDQVDGVVSTLVESAHTGRSGDGKIVVSDTNRVVRVQTGEAGESAL